MKRSEHRERRGEGPPLLLPRLRPSAAYALRAQQPLYGIDERAVDVRVDPCPQDPRRILKVLALVDEQHPARAHDGREGEIGRVPAECERGMRASWASARVRESCTEGFPMCEWLEWSAHSMAWSAASTRAAVRPAKPPPSTATRIFLVLGRAVPPPFARHGTRNASAPPSNRQCRAMLPPPTAGAMLGLRGLLSAFNSRDAEKLP